MNTKPAEFIKIGDSTELGEVVSVKHLPESIVRVEFDAAGALPDMYEFSIFDAIPIGD